MKELDFDGLEQPTLSPALLEKIADTFTRKLGRVSTPEVAQLWWDWIWPDFEIYWKRKGYRAVGRAVIGWAVRIREDELDQAIEAAELREIRALEKEQADLNARGAKLNSDSDPTVVKVDFFSQLGRRQ